VGYLLNKLNYCIGFKKLSKKRCMKMSSLYCVICGRPLSTDESISREIGPICFARLVAALEHQKDHKNKYVRFEKPGRTSKEREKAAA
jgi:hypothetical protein